MKDQNNGNFLCAKEFKTLRFQYTSSSEISMGSIFRLKLSGFEKSTVQFNFYVFSVIFPS